MTQNERYYWHGKKVGQNAEIHHLDDDGQPAVTVFESPPDGMRQLPCGRCEADFWYDPERTAIAPSVCYACSWEQRFEEAEVAVEAFTDAISDAGLPYEIWHTGGGCMAVTVALGGGEHESSYCGTRFYAMVTDGDAYLPEAGSEVTVGIYDADLDDGEWLDDRTFDEGDPAEVVRFLGEWRELVGAPA